MAKAQKQSRDEAVKLEPGEAVRLDGMPFPKGAQFTYVTRLVKGRGQSRFLLRLRVMILPSLKSDPRGSIIIAPGRTEFIEKYFETAEDFRTRGFTVFVIDHRGQGLSDRLLPDVLKSYVHRFEDYVEDLAFCLDAFKADLPRPHILVGHSMGGCLGLQGILSGDLSPDAAVMNAPMLGIVGLEQPLVAPIMSTLSNLGMATRPIPFQAQRSGLPLPFKLNKLTSDRARYSRWRAYFDGAPRLRLGGPTYGWIRAAVKSMNFVQRNAQHLKVPTLIIVAGSDRIVVPEDVVRFAKNSRAELLSLPNGLHETFLERDELRDEFFARFDTFCQSAAV